MVLATLILVCLLFFAVLVNVALTVWVTVRLRHTVIDLTAAVEVASASSARLRELSADERVTAVRQLAIAALVAHGASREMSGAGGAMTDFDKWIGVQERIAATRGEDFCDPDYRRMVADPAYASLMREVHTQEPYYAATP